MLRFTIKTGKNKRSGFKAKVLRCIAAGLVAALIPCCVSAASSVLGEQTSHSQTEYAQGTTYHRNTFYSESVDQQTENYFEYVPNSDVLPILYNGTNIYGKRTLLEASDELSENGIFAAMGMNADFFSFQTGVPMSNTIIDGRVVTKDTSWLPTIGFYGDGTAFIETSAINTFLSIGEAYFPIECINKYRQPYMMYLYTNDFGATTHAEGSGVNVVFGGVSGDITLNTEITATIESITTDDGAVAIPEGKLVLSVDSDAPQEILDRLNYLEVGQQVTFTTNEATEDPRWNDVVYATGCTGGRLLTDGELTYEDESAAPRSAIGIKADGTIIFYTIDGRQQGYSYGVRKETLARRLLELGCVDAVNLDGGGSTTLGGTLPETDEFVILNSPSESALRSCANFIFLKKMNAKSGIPYKLLTYPYGEYVLSGSTVGVWVSAIDSSYGSATLTEPVVYTISSDTPEGGSVIDSDGYLTVNGNGDIYIDTQSGDAAGSTMIHSVSVPDSITIKNADSSAISEISLNPGESYDVSAAATYLGAEITSDNGSYDWTVGDENVCNITQNDSGGMTITAVSAGTTTVTASAGGVSAQITVTVGGGAQAPAATPAPTSDTNAASYPTIVSSSDGDGYVAYVSSSNGSIAKSDITFRIDGDETDFEYDAANQQISYGYSTGFLDVARRISVVVTDPSGASAFDVLTVGNADGIENPFSDAESNWAKDIISYMAYHGIVQGSPGENGEILFNPNNGMTRAEFSVMLANFLGINVGGYSDIFLPFDDAADIPSWAINHVKAMYSLGIMQGQQNGDRLDFSPTERIRRCEYAVAVARLLPDNLYSQSLSGSDVSDIPDWALSSMEIMAANGVINGYPDGTILPNNYVTRAEAVKILYSLPF